MCVHAALSVHLYLPEHGECRQQRRLLLRIPERVGTCRCFHQAREFELEVAMYRDPVLQQVLLLSTG